MNHGMTLAYGMLEYGKMLCAHMLPPPGAALLVRASQQGSFLLGPEHVYAMGSFGRQMSIHLLQRAVRLDLFIASASKYHAQRGRACDSWKTMPAVLRGIGTVRDSMVGRV